MEKFNLDKNWKFHKGDIPYEVNTHTECYMAAKAGGAIGAASPDFDKSDWKTVNIPHDFAVENEFEEKWGPANGYKERGKGWYLKQFKLDEDDREKQLIIEFDGIAAHSVVYLNGSVVGRNFSSYNSFTVDITDMALFGDNVNNLIVFVDATPIEGWWYEGAGIYRHVNLYKKNKLHIKHHGVFVHPEKKTADVWEVHTDTEIENTGEKDKEFTLTSYIINSEDNIVGKEYTSKLCRAGEEITINQNPLTYSPCIWDIDSPNMYILKSVLTCGDEVIDSTDTSFGFRTISISADDGFYLNGRRVQLYGTCNHQDHAGVGVAVPDFVQEYRIKLLKEMGSNAYRCAHGNPSPEILEYCDKYGLLVMDENRNFNTSPEGIKQVKDMVRRDRNHPSVVMYSVFNEEPLQGADTGRRLAFTLKREIEKLDNTRFVLGAMNTGVTSDEGAAKVLDIVGFNYITDSYDGFREKYPQIPMLGSENDSAFQTRGVYKTDMDAHVIDSYDSMAAPWGNTYRDGFKQVDIRKHIMGMFIWTGFDYRGEPTPFEWPSIGTQFGIMDTCGFKKDAFYLNKAYFTDEPMIHVLPHWNHNKGDKVLAFAYTNCDEAELFLNGASLGRKPVDKYEMVSWEVEYKPGKIMAQGYKNGSLACFDEKKTSGKAYKIVLNSEREDIYYGCMDSTVINVSVEDENGTAVPDCNALIHFSVQGGEVIGVGNGDPNSHEADKSDKRRLFKGLCQAIVQKDDRCDDLIVTAEGDGLKPCTITIHAKKNDRIRYIQSVDEKYISVWRASVGMFDEKPAPDIKIDDSDMNNWSVFTPGQSVEEKYALSSGYGMYKTKVSVTGYSEIDFKNISGDYAEIYFDNKQVFEGKCPYGRRIRLPIMTNNSEMEIAVIIYCEEKNNTSGMRSPVVMVN